MLLAFWAAGLIFGFALLQHGIGGHEQLGSEPLTFGRILYHSGETFFTLGYGDIVPTSAAARILSVFEAGMGFAFLGVVIGYLPVVYGSFSRREIQISMLDARAGSPPTASELLVRLAGRSENPAIDQLVLDEVLRDWERWAGELLESHISYPVLSFFRSQHSNQSWLGALMTMLDVTSLIMAGIEGIHPGQARLTFAMARHAAVDLAQVVDMRVTTRKRRNGYQMRSSTHCGKRAGCGWIEIANQRRGAAEGLEIALDVRTVRSLDGEESDGDAAPVAALR